MKKLSFVLLLILALCASLPGCGTQDDAAANPSPSGTPSVTPEVTPSPSPSPSVAPTPTVPGSKVSADMALEGVTNYCRAQYDWSIEKDNPGIMYVEMGEETDTVGRKPACSKTDSKT